MRDLVCNAARTRLDSGLRRNDNLQAWFINKGREVGNSGELVGKVKGRKQLREKGAGRVFAAHGMTWEMGTPTARGTSQAEFVEACPCREPVTLRQAQRDLVPCRF